MQCVAIASWACPNDAWVTSILELVPVDADVDEAEYAVHDGDDNDVVAEGFESVFPSVCESFIQTSKN
jgi:hypothetical protein